MRSTTILKVLYMHTWGQQNHATSSILYPLFLINRPQNWKMKCISALPMPMRCKCNYELDIVQTKCNSQGLGEDTEPIFQPRRAVILSKMTRYEYERKLCDGMSDIEFREYLDSKDSDYLGLFERHNSHYAALEVIRKELTKANIETRVVHRLGLDQNVVDWTDVIFTAGGDGTYLFAANKFVNTSKPLIGINTDPDTSEGNLCLPKRDYSAAKFGNALKRLLSGEFGWKWRQRIQVTLSGRHLNDGPIELPEHQLVSPEHRFLEHVAENEQARALRPDNLENMQYPTRKLPCLALNEVFVGESLSSRVSYYEITIDGASKEKQKSSGVTICTGTGSSSWHFNINQLSMGSVEQILKIANQVSSSTFPVPDHEMKMKIMNGFNNSLRFDPNEPYMAYTIRSPIQTAVFNAECNSGFCKKIVIRSRMWDACLVVDGSMSFKFNDGAIATFEIAENNALRTVRKGKVK